MQLFYSSHVEDNTVCLHGQEATHCARVLRKKIGNEVNVLDGKGNLFRTIVTNLKRDKVDLKILSTEATGKKDQSLPHLAVGMIKNDTRMEWMIEKLVEVGIQGIIPVICQRSEKRTIRRIRLEKIMIGAMKQSARRFLPYLDDPIDFDQFLLDAEQSEGGKYIGHYLPSNLSLQKSLKCQENNLILIGPEGDFTTVELKRARDRGFSMMNLGNSRLRTETAAVVACAIHNSINSSN